MKLDMVSERVGSTAPTALVTAVGLLFFLPPSVLVDLCPGAFDPVRPGLV
jgi:hypothetical protein